MVELYLDNIRILGYKGSYNHYDIDVKKIVLSKKSCNEYVIRYYDVNKLAIVPLQLKIIFVFFLGGMGAGGGDGGKLHTFTNNDRVIPIHSNDKELFKKCREIWNKNTKLIGINNAKDFVETINDADEFIMVDVNKNTSSVEDNYRNKVIIPFNKFAI